MSLLSFFSRIPSVSAVFFVMAMALAGLSSSCVSRLYPLDSQAIQTRGLKPGEGYIVGTFEKTAFTRKGEKTEIGSMNKVYTERSGSGEVFAPVLMPHVMPTNRDPHLIGGGQQSEVFAIPVPAGDYKITGWSIETMGPGGPVTARNRLPMNAPFQVQEGQATYVGKYHSLSIIGKNLLGMSVFGEGAILATDDFVKDQPRIAKAYPSIRPSTIRKSGAAAAYRSEMKRTAETPRSLGEYLFR